MPRSGSQRLRQAERAQVDIGVVPADPLSDCLADRGRVLEAVARARRDDQDRLVLWVAVDQKPAVSRARVQAGCAPHRLAPEPRQVRRDAVLVDPGCLSRGRRVLTPVRLHGLLVGLRAELDAPVRAVDRGEAVDAVQMRELARLAAEVDDVGRHVAQLRIPLANREPDDELPVDREQVAALGEEIADPGAGAQHELVGLVEIRTGPHPDPAGRRGLPAEHALAESQRRPVRAGQRELGRDRQLGAEVARTGLVEGLGPLADRPHRKPGSELVGVQVLVLDLVFVRHLARLAQEPTRAVPDDEEPGPGYETLPELWPDFVRAAHQWHVLASLADRQACDPRLPVRRPPRMRRWVLVDSDHGYTSRSQLEAGGAAHRAEPDYDHLRPLHTASSVRVPRISADA